MASLSANRGVLEFSDQVKRPLDTYKYLLQTLENAYLNINGILTELDILFIGTSNEIHLTAFKQHPDFNSLKEDLTTKPLICFVTIPKRFTWNKLIQ